MTWKARINEKEYIAQDLDVLKQWVSEGRLKLEHYVFHPVLEKWMYVRDLEEVKTLNPPVLASALSTGQASGIDVTGAWCPNCRNRNSYKTRSGVGWVWIVLIFVSCGLALIMIPFLPKTWHCRVCNHQWRA